MNAAFAPDGGALYVARTGTVDRLALDGDGALSVRDWSARFKDPSHLTPAAGGAVLVVTTTAGTHTGVDAATGETLWSVDSGAEGDAPILLADGTFLTATWGGELLRIDTASGDVLARREMGHQIRGLQRTGMGISYVRIDPPRDDRSPPTDRLCGLEPEALHASPLRQALGTDNASVSPDGTRLALNRVVVRPGDRIGTRPFEVEVQELGRRVLPLAGRRVLATRLFEAQDRPKRSPRWSPDGRWLTVETKSGHLFLDADTLDTVGTLPCAYASGIVWSPDGRLICACSWEKAALLPVSEVKGLMSTG